MEVQVVIIQNETDLVAAQALISALSPSSDPVDIARLRAQALILQAYEAERRPTKSANPAEIMAYLMDQHDLTPADLRPILGSGAVARVAEILRGSKGFSLPQIRRLNAQFGIPADALIGEPAGAGNRTATP